MDKLERIQQHVWQGQLEVREQRAWIDKLRGRGMAAEQAIEQLERMETQLANLVLHRDVIRSVRANEKPRRLDRRGDTIVTLKN